MPVYGQANELTFKINALPTLVFYESQADVDSKRIEANVEAVHPGVPTMRVSARTGEGVAAGDLVHALSAVGDGVVCRGRRHLAERSRGRT